MGISPVKFEAERLLFVSNTVPVVAGKVKVFVPATAGAATVIAPEVFPVNTISAKVILLKSIIFLHIFYPSNYL